MERTTVTIVISTLLPSECQKSVTRIASAKLEKLQLFGSDPEILAQIADKNGGPTKILAQALLDEYEKLGVPIRQIVFREGSHGDYYYTNRAAAALNIPALTSEFCFIDNKEDQKFIDSEEDRQKQARAQCNAILYYFTQVQY